LSFSETCRIRAGAAARILPKLALPSVVDAEPAPGVVKFARLNALKASARN
jgi:hypothetical protein